VCSNVTLHPFDEFLAEELARYDAVVAVADFDNVWTDAASSNADFVVVHNEILNLTSEYSARFFDPNYSRDVADHLEAQIETLRQSLQRESSPKIILTSLSASTLGVSRLNAATVDLCYRYDKAVVGVSSAVIDFGRLLAEYGLNSAVSWSGFYRYVAPYEHDFLRFFARSIAAEISRQIGSLKKVLVLDLDNTLWSGVLGEDGPHGLVFDDTTPKGKCYLEVQKTIRTLAAHGALIAACSKNNLADVVGLFEQCQMTLSLDSFSHVAINWLNKTQNLKTIAQELNLGTDSFVFLDDSAFEVSNVGSRMPEVTCLQVPSDTFRYPYFFRNEIIRLFETNATTEEDSKRVAYYRTEQERKNAKAQFENEADFINSLELVLEMRVEDASGIARIAQMTNKTNQFNLTTKRYTEKEIAALIKDSDFRVITGSVSDKFGENGKTILLILSGCNSVRPQIDTFLMSCRVIGRSLEIAFADALFADLEERGYVEVAGKYIKSAKNSQVADFFDRLGFKVTSADEKAVDYVLALKDYQPKLKGNIDVRFISP
jgi:FkbH-like protein